MLDRLAGIASQLDGAGFESEADMLTAILERCAMRVAGILDEDENDGPEDDYSFFGKAWNQRPEIDASDPDFLAEFADKNPEGFKGFDEFRSKLTGRGSPSQQWMHGTPINFGPGYSGFKPRDMAEMIYPHDELVNNEQEIMNRFQRRTRDNAHRGTFNLDYASGQGPKADEPIKDFRARSRQPRKMIFDPDLYAKYMQEQNRTADPSKLNMFDADLYEPLFNPTHPQFETEDKIFKDKFSPADLRRKVEEGQLGLGGLAGYAAKSLHPGQTFGFETYKRPTDEATGLKVPNFYSRGK